MRRSLKETVAIAGPLSIGILSTAVIARKNALAIRNCDACHLIGVASRSFEKAEMFISSLNLEGVRAFGSYQALLDDPRIQAVYIPLPTTMHVEWVIKAAKAGKHVLLEKPVAVCTSDLQLMLEACADNDVFLMDGTMFVHHSRALKLQALLNTPRFKDVQRMQSTFSFRGDDAFFTKNVRGDCGLDPLGALGDLGWYCCRMAILVFVTPPLSVDAVCRKWSPDGRVPYDVSATIYFDEEGDRLCQFNCSFVSAFCQTFSISTKPTMTDGTDKIITCDDFCIPRSNMSSCYQVESIAPSPFADYGSRIMSAKETIQVGECVQEEMMFRAFAELSKSQHSATALTRRKELQNGMIACQVLMDAVLEATRTGEVVRIETIPGWG